MIKEIVVVDWGYEISFKLGGDICALISKVTPIID